MTKPDKMTRADWYAVGGVLLFLGGMVAFARLSLSAWHEERDHAAFLFDCCHGQSPEHCENVWLSQYAVSPDE